MGLDITAFSNLSPAAKRDEENLHVYTNPDFHKRADKLKAGEYKYDKALDVAAFSYSGYNNWREQLAQFAGYPAVERSMYGTEQKVFRHDQGAWNSEEGPFHELIHFSDCEGVIGPVTCEKLAGDFYMYQQLANATQDKYFIERYNALRKGFELGAQNGCVQFH